MTKKRLTRKQAIRLKCLDCSAYSKKEVRYCPVFDCPLYRYRMGHETKDDPKTNEICGKKDD